MSRINENNQQPSPVADSIEKTLANIAVSTNPVIICGVNRKVNIGNYESVDIYAGICLPVAENFDSANLDGITAVLEKVAEYGFKLTSQEANKRYQLLKEFQKGE